MSARCVLVAESTEPIAISPEVPRGSAELAYPEALLFGFADEGREPGRYVRHA